MGLNWRYIGVKYQSVIYLHGYDDGCFWTYDDDQQGNGSSHARLSKIYSYFLPIFQIKSYNKLNSYL